MSAEHDRGDIDVFVPVDKFQGDFGVMARRLNEMVANHIAAKKMAMACIKQFGEAISMRRCSSCPARRRSSTTRSNCCAPNFQAIIGEIQRLIAASTAGKLSERGDATRFPGDFAGWSAGSTGCSTRSCCRSVRAIAC